MILQNTHESVAEYPRQSEDDATCLSDVRLRRCCKARGRVGFQVGE